MERIIAKSTLVAFWNRHPDSEQYLKTWYGIAMQSQWRSPADVKETFANASILRNSRVVFNIRRNRYRLVVRINYAKQWIFIRFIGTHRQYDKIDANTI